MKQLLCVIPVALLSIACGPGGAQISVGKSPVPSPTCRFDSECDEGRLCLNAQCLPECSSTVPCAEGSACDLTKGVCKPNDPSVPDTDTQPINTCDTLSCAHACAYGKCRIPCATKNSADSIECQKYDVQLKACSAEGYCLTSTEAQSNCTTSRDCKSPLECLNGSCK